MLKTLLQYYKQHITLFRNDTSAMIKNYISNTGICDDRSVTYAYQGEYTAFYRCNNDGQMAKAQCPHREYYKTDESRCVKICAPTGVRSMPHPGRKCNKYIFCVFGSPWEMPCFSQDANCPSDCVE